MHLKDITSYYYQWVLMPIVFIYFILSIAPVVADDLNVPTQFSSIQSAIDSASAGDRVLVSAGVYHENIQLKSGVTVQGCGADACTIRANTNNSAVFASHVSDATIDGFTITGGSGYRAASSNHRIFGGGIYAENSLINIGHNKIVANRAEFGGGIGLLNSQFSIIGNTIIDNNASRPTAHNINMGGGIYMYNSHGDIHSNIISNNTVDNGHFDPTNVSGNSHQAPGGGINMVFNQNVGTVKILSNTIENNIATGSQHYGGGIYMYQSSKDLNNQIYIMNNSINGNQGLDGGGIAIVQMSPIISGNTFKNNSAHWGGAIYGWNGKGFIVHNTFDLNKALDIREGALTGGGAVLCDEDFTPFIAQNIFTNNSAVDIGGALEVYDSDASSVVWKNLFSANTARLGGGLVASTASPTIIRNYFVDNVASEAGGALFAEKTTHLSIMNNIFTNNSATHWGGGVSLFALTDSLVENNTFDGNSVDVFWGGGLHTYQGSLTLRNNQLTNNNKFAVGIDGNTVVDRSHNNFFKNDTDCFQCPESDTQLNNQPFYDKDDSFNLSTQSPHIDAGIPDVAMNDRDGSVNDIGAYGGFKSGFIVTPDMTFSSGTANKSQAVYELSAQKITLPSVEMGVEGGRLSVDLEVTHCSSSTDIFIKVMNHSVQTINNMEADQGVLYIANKLWIPDLVVGDHHYSTLFSLSYCASDHTGLYLKLDAFARH